MCSSKSLYCRLLSHKRAPRLCPPGVATRKMEPGKVFGADEVNDEVGW